jgi:Zn-dependent protease with chaperone function
LELSLSNILHRQVPHVHRHVLYSLQRWWRRRSEGGAGLPLLLVVVNAFMQLLVLAASRLGEHYADAHGAKVASTKAMISALEI